MVKYTGIVNGDNLIPYRPWTRIRGRPQKVSGAYSGREEQLLPKMSCDTSQRVIGGDEITGHGQPFGDFIRIPVHACDTALLKSPVDGNL